MKQVLVIGAAGMIGRKLTERLAKDAGLNGEEISTLTLHDVIEARAPAGAAFKIRVVTSDLSAPGEAGKLVAERPDVIFHLAAVVSGEAEAERRRALRLEIARPAFDDAHDGRVRLAADEAHRLVAGHAPQRLDLLGDGSGNARHGEVAPCSKSRAVQGGGVQQELDRRARRGKPVPHRIGHGKHRFLPAQRLAQDAGKEAGSGLVRLAGTHADRRQADADAVEEPAAAVV